MSRWRREATDDVVLEYQCAEKQIRKVLDEQWQRMRERLDQQRRQPLTPQQYFDSAFCW
jgi:hypothetical protein